MIAPPSLSAPAPASSERVDRPDPGLARGKWEAPGVVFFVLAGLAIVLVGLTFARRRKKRASS